LIDFADSPQGDVPSGQDLLTEFMRYGRQRPFEEIVRRYAGMVYNTCLRVTKDKHDAEDAAQAVFLTLALQAKKGTDIKALGPWLQQVAKRLSLDLRRGKKRRSGREQRHQEEQSWRRECADGDALPSADLDEIKTVLQDELQKLPSKYRLPLILHYFGGLSRDEMAEQLNCNTSTLGVRIFRGRALLAERLRGRGMNFNPVLLPMMLGAAVRGTVSHAMFAATSRAAAAVAAGHDGVGLVSSRVIRLTRRAAAAAFFGKLKIAAVMVLLLSTVLAAGARAVGVLPHLDLQSIVVQQVQRLIRPFFQPLLIPIQARGPGLVNPLVSPPVNPWTDPISIALHRPVGQRLSRGLPAPALADGWAVNPFAPAATLPDAIPEQPSVFDAFASSGSLDSAALANAAADQLAAESPLADADSAADDDDSADSAGGAPMMADVSTGSSANLGMGGGGGGGGGGGAGAAFTFTPGDRLAYTPADGDADSDALSLVSPAAPSVRSLSHTETAAVAARSSSGSSSSGKAGSSGPPCPPMPNHGSASGQTGASGSSTQSPDKVRHEGADPGCGSDSGLVHPLAPTSPPMSCDPGTGEPAPTGSATSALAALASADATPPPNAAWLAQLILTKDADESAAVDPSLDDSQVARPDEILAPTDGSADLSTLPTTPSLADVASSTPAVQVAAPTVPEPGCLSLLVAGGSLLLRRQSRRVGR
jgi:RNA polymerase sigma factor (sigma-70 family)